MNLFIKKVNFPLDIDKCLNIRTEVFVKGQGVPETLEVDGHDGDSEHFLATINNIPVATSRVRYNDSEAKIERVAVLDNYQGQGIGKKIMQFILDDLKMNKKIKSAKLGAQTYAIEFYEKVGFAVCSDEYMDAGIPHKYMNIFFNNIDC